MLWYVRPYGGLDIEETQGQRDTSIAPVQIFAAGKTVGQVAADHLPVCLGITEDGQLYLGRAGDDDVRTVWLLRRGVAPPPQLHEEMAEGEEVQDAVGIGGGSVQWDMLRDGYIVLPALIPKDKWLWR